MTPIVWSCECGRTFVCGLESGYCPHCHSAFGTYSGERIVTAGSWKALAEPNGDDTDMVAHD